MTGATNPNPDLIKPVDLIAYEDDKGNWHAGEDSSLQNGTFISESKANQIRHLRQRGNAVKSAMRREYQERGYDAWTDVPPSEQDEIERTARQTTQNAFERLRELDDMDELTPDERRERRALIRRDAFDS